MSTFPPPLETVPKRCCKAVGLPGTQGPQGDAAPLAAAGPQGCQGPQGCRGMPGTQGAQGDAGRAGDTGASGVTGTQGPQGNDGPVGPPGCEDCVQGAQGSQGQQGPPGIQGSGGPTGANGAIGPLGNAGSQGSQGGSGPPGLAGDTGPVGTDPGPQGPQGDDGPPSLAGPVGPQGADGGPGSEGRDGPQGTQGPDGPHPTSGLLVNLQERILILKQLLEACCITPEFCEPLASLDAGPHVGSAIVGPVSRQGSAVTMSRDGTTVAVGGPDDASGQGATWVWVRVGSTWVEEAKLVGTGGSPLDQQGASVSLSNDGSTLAVGAPGGGSVGVAYIFVRTGSVWTQQAVLQGTGSLGFSRQGASVAVSGTTGDTVAVGGPDDDAGRGATWIFQRVGTTWTQQAKLVGGGTNVGAQAQGSAVALADDGDTLAVGAPNDVSALTNSGVWIFERVASVWTQQTPERLVGPGGVGSNPEQGTAVALSADGRTLAVGGPGDDAGRGAVWVWTRFGSVWSVESIKLVATLGAVGIMGRQGSSVALTSSGSVLLVGSPWDASGMDGAVWSFQRIGTVWSPVGTKLVGPGVTGATPAAQGTSVSVSGNGQHIVVGGPGDNSNVGAAWMWACVV